MFHFALKNILFYRSRSITTVVLTFISTLLFVVYVSMMDGSHNTMLKNSLKIYTGAIEIYQKGYRYIGGSEYLIKFRCQVMLMLLRPLNNPLHSRLI